MDIPVSRSAAWGMATAVGLLLGGAPILPAVDFCVSTAGQLTSAFATAASNGSYDTVRLVQGTYNGNFVYAASSAADGLTIEGGYTASCASRTPNAANTVLDGNAAGTVLTLYSNTETSYVVDAVTIQNGVLPQVANPPNGAGLQATSCGNPPCGPTGSFVLRNSVVRNNNAFQDGGGVYTYQFDSVLLQGNTIQNNRAGFGAGSYSVDCRQLIFENNTYSGNTSHYTLDDRGDGGGIFVDTTFPNTGYTGSTRVTLRGNSISSNTARRSGGGVFIFNSDTGVQDSTIEVTDNVIAQNGNGTTSFPTVKTESGGGFGIAYGTRLSFLRNTVDGNRASANAGGLAIHFNRDALLASNLVRANVAGSDDGAGIRAFQLERFTLTNNTVTGNTATSGFGGGISLQRTAASLEASLHNNIVWGNAAPGTGATADLSIVNGGAPGLSLLDNDFDQSVAGFFITGAAGFSIDPSNFNNANPLFVGASDFHLQAGSPLRDQGRSDAARLPAYDRDKGFRISGAAVDLGAFEFGTLPFHRRHNVDFNADERRDHTVYHAASGLWFIRDSVTGASSSVGYGGPGYVPVAGDYDGDTRTDLAVYHAASGLWFIRQSSNGVDLAIAYGGTDYTPVPGDYDGDGKTDIAVYHAASGLWFLRLSTTGLTSSVGWGGTDYTPIPEDYDGDGKTDVTVFHAASGLWFVRQSASGTTFSLAFGGPGYTLVPRDYDGDGRADLAVYHVASGTWFVRQSTTSTTFSLGFGGAAYTPVPGYFDGDGRADLAAYHQLSGLWFVRSSQTVIVASVAYGGAGFDPVR